MSTPTAAPSERDVPSVSTAVVRPYALLRWAARGLIVLLLALAGWWTFDIGFGDNLHTVIPGRVYRGAQPTAESLERIVRDHGIRTVVNLRGCGNPSSWYLDEGRTAEQLGISQEDVSFSAIHLPAPSELRELIDVLDRSKYPIFLHCRHGADRTGMAAAIVLLLQDDIPYAQARRELGLRYGHLSFGKTGQLDRFFGLYEDWLGKTGNKHSAARFREWVLNEYRGGWCEGGVEHVEPLGSARAGKPIAYRVRLRNRSQAVWQFKPTITAGVHVFYRVWDSEGKWAGEGRAGFLEATVPPGDRLDVTMVLPPLAAGQYYIAVDLVEEFHCWFSQVGAEPWEQELVVRE